MKRPFFAPDFPAGGSRGFLAKGTRQKNTPSGEGEVDDGDTCGSCARRIAALSLSLFLVAVLIKLESIAVITAPGFVSKARRLLHD